MEILVSVIVPLYNASNHLKDCVDSILSQSYRNIEVILVDDGSTDMSGEICDEYAKQDSRVKIIHKPNGGAADARNTGIAAATGKYVVFVDSDDFILAGFIECVLCIAERKSADIVVTDFQLYREGEPIENIILGDRDLNEAETLSEKNLYDEDFIKNETVRFTVPWGKICARKLYDGIVYPVGKTNEDTHTTWKLMERANKVIYLKKKLYYWRDNPDSVTRCAFSLSQLSGLEAFQEQLEYFHAAGRQRYVEIVYEQYRDWFFSCYNEMKEAGMDYGSELKPYYQYMKKHVHWIKYTKSLGLYNWIKYRYLVYYKVPKILKCG